jgi:hypothetical protein
MSGAKIIRVFPRRTKATPADELAFVGPPPMFVPEADEIHISVTFTWDIPEAERIERAWRKHGKTTIGGPAFERPGGNFVPGRYLKQGYVITSRGCPNSCWFCSVPKREGHVMRELPIVDGWNVLDDNFIASSDEHFSAVVSMLHRQERRTEFTGGIEAAKLTHERAAIIAALKPKQVFFAYDTPDDLKHLKKAANVFREIGWGNRHSLRCYCLVGFPGDTRERAETRLRQIMALNMGPMAMAFRDHSGSVAEEWRAFQREWARPAIIYRRLVPESKSIFERANP